MMTAHHAFADGVQFLSTLKFLGTNPDDQLKPMAIIPFWNRMMAYAIYPALILKSAM